MTYNYPQKKYNCLYLTTNLINNRYYYGVHATNNMDDGYLGSGHALKLAIKKYGKAKFSKEVLQVFPTIQEAYFAESLLVTEEELRDPKCYNITLGGWGCPLTPEQIVYRNSRIKEGHNNPITRRMLSENSKAMWSDPEFKSLISAKIKKSWESPELRKQLSDKLKTILGTTENSLRASIHANKLWENPNHIELMRDKSKKSWKDPEIRKRRMKGLIANGRTEEFRDKMSTVNKSNYESSSRMKEALDKGRTPECRKAVGKKISATVWVHNFEEGKRIHKDLLNEYLAKGWLKGMKLKRIAS